jgi:hypothetical protein
MKGKPVETSLLNTNLRKEVQLSFKGNHFKSGVLKEHEKTRYDCKNK